MWDYFLKILRIEKYTVFLLISLNVFLVSFLNSSSNFTLANSYLFKIRNKSTRKRSRIYSKLTIKIPEAEKTWREDVFSTIVAVKFAMLLPLGVLPLLLKNIAIDFVGKIACIQQTFVWKHFLNREFIE